MSYKVFLGNAPWEKDEFYGVRAGSRWPHFESIHSEYMPFPFFLAYSSALLKREGFEVDIVDGIAERMSELAFLDRLESFQPDCVVFEVSTISIRTDLEYARKTRERLGKEVRIIFCGLHTHMTEPEFLIEHGDIDMVMIGEYEMTLLELVTKLREGLSAAGVEGTLVRTDSGEVIKAEPRDILKDLDYLPWPDRSSLPMDHYLDTPGNIPRPSVQMWASRGCPYQCVFCAWPQIMYGGHRYRYRDPVKVVDEMEYLIKEKGFRSVYFDDDTFNIGKKRILAICNEICQRKLNVPWAIMARADTMDEEMLVALKAAGMCALKYGVESADQTLVDRAGKGLDLQKVREIVKKTKDMGIFIHLTFTFGLPGETKESIDKTIELAKELDPDSLQFSIITPFPGSLLYQELEQKGHLISKNWEEYDGYSTAVIKTDTLSKEDLEGALHKARLEWDRHRFLKGVREEPHKALLRAFHNPGNAFRRLKRVVSSFIS